MATRISPVVGANYAYTRIYLQSVIDTLAAVGWVRSEAAGQMNVETAPLAGSALGWLTFESTDALSAEAKIYLRLGFSNGSRGTGVATMITAMQVGFQIDESGSLVEGTFAWRSMLLPSASYPAATGAGYVQSTFASGDGGSLRWCDQPERYAYSASLPNLGVHANSFFAIARTKDENGNPTTDGLVICSADGGIATSSMAMVMSTLSRAAGPTLIGSRCLCPLLTESAPVGSSTFAQAGRVASVGGLPQLQHPWACTPRLYPFEDIAYLPSYSAASVGDVMNVQVGAELKKYLFVGRTGACPSVVGGYGRTARSFTENADMFLDAGIAILWE